MNKFRIILRWQSFLYSLKLPICIGSGLISVKQISLTNARVKSKTKENQLYSFPNKSFQFIRCSISKCINCFCCDYGRSLNFIAKLLLSTIFSTPENNETSPAFQLNCDWLLSLKYDFFIMKSKQNFRNDCKRSPAFQRIQMKRQKVVNKKVSHATHCTKFYLWILLWQCGIFHFRRQKLVHNFLANFAVEQSNNWQMKVHL